MSSNSNVRAARFVRGFFHFLEERSIRAAVLHGGQDGFEHDLSDVDFVIDSSWFGKLADLINEYCRHSDWQLCQILHHETTASFCICSANDYPACAVALDACSDYQRNGTVFLTASDLLAHRTLLPWNGHGVSPATELRYRFVKAAAKSKEAEACADEFARYPETARSECAAWLAAEWGLAPPSWDAAGLAPTLAKLGRKSNRPLSLIHRGTFRRVLSRIVNPTGIIVITGHENCNRDAARIEQVFGHLYFRRTRKAARWKPVMFKDLIASTLIILPELGDLWSKLIPANCIHRLDSSQDSDSQSITLAKHLHQRCMRRGITREN